MGRSDCGTWWVVQVLLYPVYGQMFAARGFNTVQLHHLPPLVCFRPCRQRNRTDNSTCIDHQGRLSPSVSLCIFFPFLGCFSCRLLRPSPSTRENSNWTLETPGSLLRTCHLSFVQIMVRVTETALCLFILLCFFFVLAVLVSLSLLGRRRERETDSQRQKKKKKKTHSQLWVWGNDQKRAV